MSQPSTAFHIFPSSIERTSLSRNGSGRCWQSGRDQQAELWWFSGFGATFGDTYLGSSKFGAFHPFSCSTVHAIHLLKHLFDFFLSEFGKSVAVLSTGGPKNKVSGDCQHLSIFGCRPSASDEIDKFITSCCNQEVTILIHRCIYNHLIVIIYKLHTCGSNITSVSLCYQLPWKDISQLGSLAHLLGYTLLQFNIVENHPCVNY